MKNLLLNIGIQPKNFWEYSFCETCKFYSLEVYSMLEKNSFFSTKCRLLYNYGKTHEIKNLDIPFCKKIEKTEQQLLDLLNIQNINNYIILVIEDDCSDCYFNTQIKNTIDRECIVFNKKLKKKNDKYIKCNDCQKAEI